MAGSGGFIPLPWRRSFRSRRCGSAGGFSRTTRARRHKFYDPKGRQYDQMTQAARSGRQNIIEGSERAATSKDTEMKLTDVARASLSELRGDYEMVILDRGQLPWSVHAAEAKAVNAVSLDPAPFEDDMVHESAKHALQQRKKYARWLDADDAGCNGMPDHRAGLNMLQPDRIKRLERPRIQRASDQNGSKRGGQTRAGMPSCGKAMPVQVGQGLFSVAAFPGAKNSRWHEPRSERGGPIDFVDLIDNGNEGNNSLRSSTRAAAGAGSAVVSRRGRVRKSRFLWIDRVWDGAIMHFIAPVCWHSI
jgi:hypothetical protein